MPDRHHDELIRALIFSLIINLLIVFMLVGQHRAGKTARSLPFVVSIETGRSAVPRELALIVRAVAIPSAERQKMNPLPDEVSFSLPQSFSVAPPLPSQENNNDEAGSRVVSTKTERGGTDPLPAPTTERSTAATADESGGGMSISGDKIAGDDYTAAELLAGSKPDYPQRANRNGWEGTVILTLSIDAKGQVVKVNIAKTSGYDLLDRSACTAVSAWQFSPARRNGVAIAESIHLPIIFRRPLPEND